MAFFMAFAQPDNCEVPAERQDCSGSRSFVMMVSSI
jgi:hypothetical protein